MSTLTPIFDHSSFRMIAVLMRSWLLLAMINGSVKPLGTEEAAINACALARS